MIPSNDMAIPLQSAVLGYFAGERQEGLFILGGSALFAALASWLWGAARSGFAVAFAVTVVATAVLLSATAGWLLVRDKTLSGALVQGMASALESQVVEAERDRIAAVVSRYPRYRHAAAAIAAISLLGLWLSGSEWVHGFAAGLLLLVVAQVVIDHFSERRAGTYFDHLSAWAAG